MTEIVENIVETRIGLYKFAEMTEETESALKDTCKRFAKDMRYDMQFEYYSVYWTEQNWLLAKLAMPEVPTILNRVN